MTFRRFAYYLGKIASDTIRRVQSAPHHPIPAEWRDDRITAAWLGHSTVLIDFLGVWILTDPVLAARVGLRFGPFTLGPKRYIAPALTVREIPPLDIILLSHAHMDHLDTWTLKSLRQKCTVVTASKTADLLPHRHFQQVRELGWGESATIETAHGSIEIVAFQVQHWGARMRTDDHRGYNGYLLTRAGRRICFSGDTARTTAFRGLSGKGGIDLMIAPIGAYNPWIRSHCTPEEAVAMADDAGARFVMPVHHQTFKLSAEPMDEPLRRFESALAGEPTRIALRHIGETWRSPA